MENEKKLNEIPKENMMENMKAIPLEDEALEAAAGGYLQVSKWVQYLVSAILPPLYNLSSSANGNDKSIIDGIISTLRNTMVPGAAVAQPVKNLWYSFNPSAFQDRSICLQVVNLLQSAYQYIVSNS